MITALHQVFGRKYGVDFGTFIYSEISGINGFLPVNTTGTFSYSLDRKGGNTAVQFGSGYLQTVDYLPASNVWSFSFWIKTSQTSLEGYLVSLTSNYYGNQAFVCEINFQSQNVLLSGISASPYNFKTLNTNLNNNTWRHIVLVFDRSQSANNEIKVYIDSILQTLSIFSSNNGDHTGNFVSDKLYIGASASNMYNYNGIMDDIKIFNRPLTQTEITNLYNE